MKLYFYFTLKYSNLIKQFSKKNEKKPLLMKSDFVFIKEKKNTLNSTCTKIYDVFSS